MTILFDKIVHEFDPDQRFVEYDRAQPVAVDPSDTFVVLTQWDGNGDFQHCILIERRDKQALIEALMKA